MAALAAVTGLTSAQAAEPPGCEGPGQVTVVVDPQELGGEPTERCVDLADVEGEVALDVLEAAGHEVEGSAEFGDAVVCRVDGAPAPEAESCRSMPSADAYWTFWLADGEAWIFAQQGVDSQPVAGGDVLAMSFQQGTDEAPPRVDPAAAAARAEPAARLSQEESSTTGWALSVTETLAWGLAIVAVVATLLVTRLLRRRRHG